MTRSKASTSAWAALGSRQRPIANTLLKAEVVRRAQLLRIEHEPEGAAASELEGVNPRLDQDELEALLRDHGTS